MYTVACVVYYVNNQQHHLFETVLLQLQLICRAKVADSEAGICGLKMFHVLFRDMCMHVSVCMCVCVCVCLCDDDDDDDDDVCVCVCV